MSITLKEFEASNDMCVEHPYNPEKLDTDVDDYFSEADFELERQGDGDYNEVMALIDELASVAKVVYVYKKEQVKIDPDWFIDIIKDHMEDEYGLSEFGTIEGEDELEEALKEFNSKQTAYISSEKIGDLDFSKELKNHLIAHTLAIPHLERYLEAGNEAHFDFDNMITFSDGQFIVEMAESGGGYSVFDVFNDLRLAREYAIKLTPENEHVLRLEFTGSDLDKASEALGMVEA